MSLMTVDKKRWDSFPPEIRLIILNILLQDGCSLASLATVSREWQTIIERHNFARIKLTRSRLADFGANVYRNRALVGYLWLCVELEEYDCNRRPPSDLDWSPPSVLDWNPRPCMSEADSVLVTEAIQDLFSALGAWEEARDNGGLLLDISVHSPSDPTHWLNYPTLQPDTPSGECGRDGCGEQAVLVRDNDRVHGCVASRRGLTWYCEAADRPYEDIMGRGPFCYHHDEDDWWKTLPSVPAVTGVLLRQQTGRRWKPRALENMFSRFPSLQEIHYEPWREPDWFMRGFTDSGE